MDPHDAVLPMKDGTCIRLPVAQAVVGRLFAKVAEGQPGGLDDDETEEMMRLLDGLQTEARRLRPGDRVRDGAEGQITFMQLILELAQQLQRTLAVACIECGRQLSAASTDVRLEVTPDAEPVFYCAECWKRKFRGWERG